MRDAVLTCAGVGLVYPDGTRANAGIDLELRAGELVCLLGPNGAGKTTLVRQITTELRPTEGQIRIFGADPDDNQVATRLQLGVIPQHVGLYDGLRVEEHLRLFAPLKRIRTRERRREVERLLAECDLGPLRARRVGTLSGGERRRLLIALALMGAPPILVLDEPTVGLDPVTRRACWETLRRQRRAGTAILLTTHYLDEAERLADRIAIIAGGRLTHCGTLAELYAQVGRSHRVRVHDPASGAIRQQRYFDSLEEARRFCAESQHDSFAVERVSLEDVYLEVVGRGVGADGGVA